MVNQEHKFNRHLAFGLVLCLCMILSAPLTSYALYEIPHKIHSVTVQSGVLANSSSKEAVVYSQVVDLGNVPWVRLFFDSVQLEGGSYLRITSREDGAMQILNRETLAEWQNSTAYFNGPAVTVELVAAPSTKSNSASIKQAVAGDPNSPSQPTETFKVCVKNDRRNSSSDPATARLLDINLTPCTGFITNRRPKDDDSDRCMLSAGHCFTPPTSEVVQFGVPPSSNDCSIQHPGPEKQFIINPATVRFVKGPSWYDDYAVFRCFRNSNTRKTVFEQQNAEFSLGAPDTGRAWIFGYGADGDPRDYDPDTVKNCKCRRLDGNATKNYTQQTDTSKIVKLYGVRGVDHNIHTCGGNSGSPIVQNGKAVAIQTLGGCLDTLPFTYNWGTSVTHPGLQAFLNSCCDSFIDQWYFKNKKLYSFCGVPDFDQRQMPPAFCGPTAAANCVSWLQDGVHPSVPGLIDQIATASQTDPVLGTQCDRLGPAIIEVMSSHGGWWFTQSTIHNPTFSDLATNLIDKKGNEVLLLGFWQYDDWSGYWHRFGGHFVSLAGINVRDVQLALSDPFQDEAETGARPGTVCGVHTPPSDPYDHNSGITSHDYYNAYWPSPCPGGIVKLDSFETFWPYFNGQNFRPEHLPYISAYDPLSEVVTVVEQATVISENSQYMQNCVEGGAAYECDNNYGGIADRYWEVNFSGNNWRNGAYYGSYILGTYQGDLACSYGGYHPNRSFLLLGPPVRDSFTVTGGAGDYKIEQLTLQFKHPLEEYNIYITEYVFAFWVPLGGNPNSELAIEHVFVLNNWGSNGISGLQSGIINDIDILDNFCQVNFDRQHQSMWMYPASNDTLVFGMTREPARVGDLAITGWGLCNYLRMDTDQYLSSLKGWMETRDWGVDSSTENVNRTLLFADNSFDLPVGGIRIENWIKWGYPAAITSGGDANWRHFLYDILHQMGYYRGDVNKDGTISVSDVVYLINYLFKGGPSPAEFVDQGDVNADGKVTVSDVIYIINYLFKAGPAPVDRNRFFMTSPYVDGYYKYYCQPRNPGLFGDPNWKNLGR